MAASTRLDLAQACTVTITLCAVVVTGLVVRREIRPVARPTVERTTPIVGRPVPGNAPLPSTQLVSDSGGTVRVIEFADFECPFCADAAMAIDRFSKEHPRLISIEFHHLPIPGHRYARAAAQAAECAGEQHRFREFYFLAYANQSKLGQWSWKEFGRRSGVPDPSEFEACVESGRFGARIDADIAAATTLGLRGTPSWVVRDSIYGGVPPRSQLALWVATR